jgi:outer membrane protein OmpA-like peptidoglycan-associated protein
LYQRARASADAAHSRETETATRTASRAPSSSSGFTAWTGNQTRLRHLGNPPPSDLVLQRKLAIGAINDPLELEADRTAERILRMPEQAVSVSPAVVSNAAPPTLRRCSCGGSSGAGSCTTCKDEVELQRKRLGPTPISEAPGIVHEVLRSSGQPLDRATRSFFEPRFGHDFSGVRLHTGARAAESARQVNALAYTVGSNVVFRTQQFAPNTAQGRRLLAHELTHVVQQRRNGQSASSTLRRAEVPSAPAPAAKNAVPVRQSNPANGCYSDRRLNGRGMTHEFGTTRWVLSNFDVDQHYIKKEHFDFLKSTVVPKINATPAGKFLVTVVGEASTTADFFYNLDLSKQRAKCVAEELVAAGLDDQHLANVVTETGELRGDLEQISHGIDPRIGIEDWTKRMVTIFLLPARSCTPEQKSRAAHKFYVKVACDSKSAIRINIGLDDPAQPIYREFVWLHNPWPRGCTFIPGLPPDFKSHYDFVKTAVDLRLATKDPDQIDGPSDFTGPLTFIADGANEYLARGIGIFELFRIGLGGEWKPESCGARSQIVEGSLVPLGPVQCGWAPDPPGHCNFTDENDKCSDDHKMAASKRFNGYMFGGSISAKELLELLAKEAPTWATAIDRLVDKIPSFLRNLLDPGGLILNIQFGTKDAKLDPPLTRSFIFVGAGNQGGGSSFTDHFKGAVAPEQDASEPSQLATENPDSIWASSDLSTLLGKVVIHGASNKIELKTGAGTFNFFTPHLLCNHGGTRTYRGLFLPRGAVNCPDHIALPEPSETECKDEEICPESTRTAGHKKFTVKVGRATLASLPLAGRRLADQFGCKVGAAFLNIQSEDGPKEKQIHREFFVIFEQKNCRFTVGNANVPISGWLSRQLAIDDPDSIFASSDFHPGAELNRDGELRLISPSNYPLIFKMPGAFDPACKVRSRAWGAAGPKSAVDCGPAPEPTHDTTPDVNHTDHCNQFKKQHAYFVDPYIHLIGGSDYQAIYAQLPPGRAIIPPDEFGYYKEDYVDFHQQTISPAVFIALAQDPQGGQPIQAVAFADLRIIRITLDGWMEVEFLTDVCAFDEFGNVVLIRPNNCLEGFDHAGDTEIIRPVPVSPPRVHRPKPPVRHKLAVGSVDDPLESEADRTADRVLRMPEQAVSAPPATSQSALPSLRRCSCGGTCDSCRQEDDKLQRKPSGPTATAEAPDLVHQELLAPGQPLDDDTRAFMELRFGRNFSAVRVHTGDRAAESARQVDSLAYTVGSSIVFGAGAYAPSTAAGRRLIAHELAHVVQQRAASLTLQRQRKPVAKSSPPKPRKDYVFIMGEDEKNTRNPFFKYAKLYFQSHLPQATFVEDKRTFADLLDWISANVTEPIGNLYIVSHGNENGTLFFGLNASSRSMTVIDLRDALHPSGGGTSTLTSVSSVIDAKTTIHIKGCDIGRTREIVELLDEAFGGKGTVTAPTHEQRYEADPYLGAQARQQAHDKDIADFTSKLPPLPDEPAPIDRSLRGEARKRAKNAYDEAKAARRKAQAERIQSISAEEKRIKVDLNAVEAKAKVIDLLTGPLFQRPGTTLFDLKEIQPQVDRLYPHLSDDQRKSLAKRLITPDRGRPQDQQGQKVERLTYAETFNEPASVDEAVALFGKSFRAEHFIPHDITREQTRDAEPKAIYHLSGIARRPGSQAQEFHWASTEQSIPDEKAALAAGKAKVNNPDRFRWHVERKHDRSGVTTLTVVAERVIAYLHHASLDAKPHEHFTKPEDNPDFYTTSTFPQPTPPKK